MNFFHLIFPCAHIFCQLRPHAISFLMGRPFRPLFLVEVGELFESIFRVIMIFFLCVVDSNTSDKIRTIRARITCNNARNLDLRYLKRLLVQTDKQEDFISLRDFCIYLASDNTLKILVYSNQMTSWWGCAARFSKSWPYFRPKNVIFNTRFQTYPLRNYVIIT